MFFKRPRTAQPEYDPARLPRHIAIIMDGNGRWARKRGLPRQAGHAVGSETFRRIAKLCRDIGVEYLTVFAFSTENWKRPAEEVSTIMDLLRRYLNEALEKMEADRINLGFLGDLSNLPGDITALIEKTNERSKTYDGMKVNVCVNYGGRADILQAARRLAEACAAGELASDDINEELFSARLYSAGIPDPDLVIRPSGELRISNFLLWQSAYSEYYFTDTLWPDFDRGELLRAIRAYQSRSRRFGGV